MTDTIFVRGLLLHAFHGVGEDERQLGQHFLLDLTLELDLASAARSDKLADTVSYAEVVAVASAAFRAEPFRLIEAAAGVVAEAILARFPRVQAIAVSVHKPDAPMAAIFADCGVTMTRSRRG